MGSLTLVRHGQASYGAANYDRLSPRGVEQARALGRRWAEDRLDIDALYTGPMTRQVDTAALARTAAAEAGHPVPEPIVMAELAEYPAFELLGRFLPRLIAEHPELAALADGSAPPDQRRALLDRGFWLIVDGWSTGSLDTGDIERFDAFVERVQRGLASIIERHPTSGQRVVAVTSGGPIGVTLKLVLGLDALGTVNLWRLVRNASTTELLWRSNGFAWRTGDLSLLGFNHVDHLDHSLITFR